MSESGVLQIRGGISGVWGELYSVNEVSPHSLKSDFFRVGRVHSPKSECSLGPLSNTAIAAPVCTAAQLLTL